MSDEVLTAEEIKDIRKYARTVFFKNQYLFKSTTCEDIEQDFLLEYLQTKNKEHLASTIIYRYTASSDKVAVRDFIPFSVFEHETAKSGDIYITF